MFEVIHKVITAFPIQIILAECLFLGKLQRKKGFCALYLSAVAALLLLFFLMPQVKGGINVIYGGVFILTVALLWGGCENGWESVLFCCVGAYAIQHLAFNTVCVFWILNSMDGFGTLFDTGLYVWGDYDIFQWGWKAVPVYLGIYASIYGACYCLFIRRLDKLEVMELKNISQIILGLGIIAFTFGASAIFCCVMVLILQFGLVSRERLLREQAQMEAMLELSERQRKISKENIDIINIKCHDLKKQVGALRKLPDYENNLREIEQAIDIYDSVVETGNEALDIVLTEKSLLCERTDIRFTYMVDGKALGFMNSADIYAMFGNALDNAIEAVRCEEVENRIITLTVRGKHGNLSIMMDNYCGRIVTFEDGLPVTTKRDKRHHGFGTKSIAFIAEKYQGRVHMYQEDDRFCIKVTVPIPD